MEEASRRMAGAAAGRAGSRDFGQLRRLARHLAPYRAMVAGAVLALVVAAASVLVLGIGVRHLIDGGFSAGRAQALDHALRAVMIVIVVLAAATFARSYLVAWLGERVVADLRAQVYGKVVRLSPGFFEVTRTGEVLSRLTTDTAVIQTVIGASVTQALRNILLVTGGLLMLVVTNPRLTALVLIGVPLVVVPIVVIGRVVRRLSREAQDRIAATSARAEESLNAVHTVQSFAQEDREQGRFRAAAEEAFGAAVRHARARSTLGAIAIAVVFTAICVVLWIGGHDVLAGRITAGELAAFVFYAAIVASATGGLSEVVGELQRAAGAAERLFELLDTEPEIAAPASPRPLPSPARGEVRFEGVAFAYPSQPERQVLGCFDLHVQPGETVALVGPSGAGKTSVFQLLMRFYDPQAGRVLFDGVPITEVDPRDVRRRVALVPQEPVIFSADAIENIRYGRPEASETEVVAAARSAHAAEFIERLPDGYRTFLGEKGVRLSGGQRQRIAIARALLCDPALLLLDEATSSLDSESERVVQDALEAVRRARTTIVIAHRLATVLEADRIVVMDQGRVVAIGTHAQLLREEGLYARLAELQLAPGRFAVE